MYITTLLDTVSKTDYVRTKRLELPKISNLLLQLA